MSGANGSTHVENKGATPHYRALRLLKKTNNYGLFFAVALVLAGVASLPAQDSVGGEGERDEVECH